MYQQDIEELKAVADDFLKVMTPDNAQAVRDRFPAVIAVLEDYDNMSVELASFRDENAVLEASNEECRKLLKEAADKLQCYACAESDTNDSLSNEIYKFLEGFYV